PPPPCVCDAVGKAEMADLRLYSDPECRVLKAKLAAHYGVSEDMVFLSNGSDEVLNFACMAYGKKGAVFPDITYGFYKVFADLYGIDTQIIPLREDFTLPVDRFLGQNRLLLIANPNAPTGIFLPLDEIERIVAENPDGVVVVDEAYIDFGGQSALCLLSRYENLLVVRTYSKSRSMAGARLGFAFGSSELIADLERIKYATNPYNINRLTQLAGAAALDDEAYYREKCDEIIRTRDIVTRNLRDFGFTVTDSLANFVFARHSTFGGKAFYEAMKENGILIRHFEGERLSAYNRITIGSPEEMEIFSRTAASIIGGMI
ncbi:MAG: histidinol-phosphate transaminase, partial [Clostridia bacterium]|nr:histidinol-phosphate transaminase [Clostridia bacterium]